MLSGYMTKNSPLLAGLLASCIGFALPVTTLGQETQRSNWTSADDSCAKYNDLRKSVLGNIGVRIDASLAWADAFRRALSFWNTVLAANFYEETKLDACAVRIFDGGEGILRNAIVARSQMTERINFRGKIAVSPRATKEMSADEMYAASVHELGHMLGLKHSTNSQSVMYFLDVNGTEALDANDLLALSTHHKLRSDIAPTRFLPIQLAQP